MRRFSPATLLDIFMVHFDCALTLLLSTSWREEDQGMLISGFEALVLFQQDPSKPVFASAAHCH
jgi:hypothetical protein